MILSKYYDYKIYLDYLTGTEMEHIEVVYWSDVRDEIINVAPALAAIIDEINPGTEYPLYCVAYPYGSSILEFSLGFHLPVEGGISVPITDSRIPQFIRDDLSYQTLPFGMILKNSVEIYRELDNKVFSTRLFSANCEIELGIWEYFGWQTPYSVSSGARSVYMVPKISLASEHAKLKKTFSNLTASPPNSLFNHCEIFKEIALSPEFTNKWFAKVIYFGKKWHESLDQPTYQWSQLKSYILKKGWNHSNFGRKRLLFDFTWESIAKLMNSRGFKPSAYTIDTLKHLFTILFGDLSASAPFIGDDSYGPFNDIQRIYTDIYNLKEYIPTIMCPQVFDMSSAKQVYYSLQTPTFLSATPGLKVGMSNVEYMQELIDIIKYIKQLSNSGLKIDKVYFYEILQNIEFDFFHSDCYLNKNKSIKLTSTMPQEDKNLEYSAIKNDSRKFCENGGFIRGCIRIRKLK